MIASLRLLAPRYAVRRVTDLSPALLRAWRIDALMLDLDNTLVAWAEAAAPAVVCAWVAELRQAGIRACIVSNNLSGRVRTVAAQLQLPAAEGRFKPSADKLRRALRILGSAPERTAMVGDQIFTDVLAGNRLGVPTILTEPLGPQEPMRIRMLRRIEHVLMALMARRGLVPRGLDV
ncbi:MAG: YqeG family HAD IIIA-type phosphatase [Armatimonadota bacterium]|nr:YqeG family HAD IIIA-type phosphatase [Armatimonadota bacterium]